VITEWFIQAVLALVSVPLAVLPVLSPAPTFDVSAAFSGAMAFNAGVPVTEMVAGIGILLAAASASFLFGVVRQVWRFVPFIGGG
jgi:hypothetical protein